MQGLRIHSKQWKLIAEMIKTRTVVQIRTHAQKYFQKLLKLKSGCDVNIDNIDNLLESAIMNTIKPENTDGAPIITPRTKRKQPASRPQQSQSQQQLQSNVGVVGSNATSSSYMSACFTDGYIAGALPPQYMMNSANGVGVYSTEVEYLIH
jgi:hypothetical protein